MFIWSCAANYRKKLRGKKGVVVSSKVKRFRYYNREFISYTPSAYRGSDQLCEALIVRMLEVNALGAK